MRHSILFGALMALATTATAAASVGDADQRLAYALAAVPGVVLVDVDQLADALELDDWRVERVDDDAVG